MEFKDLKLGMKGRVKHSSGVNKKGDIGVITELGSDFGEDFRLDTGRGNVGNWMNLNNCEIIYPKGKIKEFISLELTGIESDSNRHTYTTASISQLPFNLSVEIEREPKNVSEFIEANDLKESEVLEYLNKKINKLKTIK